MSLTELQTRTDRPHLDQYLRWVVAGCSVTAAAIHFGFAPAHLAENWAHGVFFLFMGWSQAVFALLIIVRPRRWLWAGALLLNAGIIATWTVSRSVGVPFGPVALRHEAVTAPDLFATLLAGVVVVVALAALLLPSLFDRPVRARLVLPTFATGTIVAVVVMGSVTLTPRFAGAHGHTHSNAGPGQVETITAALTGKSPCELSGPAASPGQLANDAEGHSHRGPQVQQPIDQPTLDALASQQLQARSVAFKYPHVADATRAGYAMSTPYVPCIGAHYTKVMLAVAPFDPAAPSELLYDGTKPDSKIVGLSFLLLHPGGPPDGFAGPNDHWHQHNVNGGLCFSQHTGVVIGGEDTSVAECQGRGGVKRPLPDIWMLHDWIVPGWECTWGVFAGECPELGGRLGGTAWEPPDPKTAKLAAAAAAQS